VAAYQHSGNAYAERTARTVLKLYRSIMAEYRIPPEEWHEIAPLVQAAINSAKRKSLGGFSPIEIFEGHKPIRPLDGILKSLRPKIKLVEAEESEARVQDLVTKFVQERDEMRKEMLQAAQKMRTQTRKANDNYNRKALALEANVGDFVLVAAKTQRSKLESRWTGPYIVTEESNEHLRKVKSLMDQHVEEVHVSRLIRFVNRLNNSEALLKEQAGYLGNEFEAAAVVGHVKRGREFWLIVRWRGFQPEDDTAEPWLNIWEAAPQAVEEYLSGLDKDDPVVRFFSRKRIVGSREE
jgi:hypothetical protein